MAYYFMFHSFLKKEENRGDQMKTKVIILWISSIIVLCGCTQQMNQPSLEKLGMISVIAVDYVDDDTMKMTVILPQPAAEAMKHTQVFSIETEMIHKGIVEISAKADKTVTLRQLRVVMFSEEFAKNGKMKEVVEYLYKDTEVRSNTFLAVVKDSAGELLTSEYPDKQNTSVYINNLFQPRLYTFFSPFTTVHEFVYDQTNPLLDAITPYVELKNGLINIEGIAAFKDGDLSYVFTQQEGKSIQILRGQNNLSVLAVTLDKDSSDKEKVVLEFIRSKAKIKSNHDLASPKIKISLKFEGTLSEYEGEKDLANKTELASLEKEISKNIEEDIRGFLQKCQELSIDPVGLFESYRMQYKGDWSSDLTEQLLAKAEFEIVAETEVLSSGTLK
jgi:spore germination protein